MRKPHLQITTSADSVSPCSVGPLVRSRRMPLQAQPDRAQIGSSRHVRLVTTCETE